MLVIGLPVVVGVVRVARRQRARARAEMEEVIAELGWRYSAGDPGNVFALPFRLFATFRRRRPQQSVSHFLIGQHAGHPAQLFTYTRKEGSSPRENTGIRVAAEEPDCFSCLLLEISATCPSLTLRRDLTLIELVDHRGKGDR